jgi:hypothetical protein
MREFVRAFHATTGIFMNDRSNWESQTALGIPNLAWTKEQAVSSARLSRYDA